jgi:hypothetical protein
VTVIGAILWAYAAACIIGGLIAAILPLFSYYSSPHAVADQMGRNLLWSALRVLPYLAFYCFILVASTAFLSMRAWGRLAVEGLLWLLTAFLGFGVCWMIYWMASSSGQRPSVDPAMPVLTAVIWLGLAAIPVSAIQSLRRPAVRDAFAAAEAARKAARSAAPVEP